MARGSAATPAPDADVWFQGLRWVEAVRMQANRFDYAFRELRVAELDAATRERLNGDGNESAASRARSDAETEIGMRPVRVPSWALEMQVTTEAEFLLVAIRNLLRAQQRLPVDRLTSMRDEEVLKLLRDAAEHYDEQGGRAHEALAVQHPRILTESFVYTTKEIWIGGSAGVPLSRIEAWAERVELALRDALNDAGMDIPEDLLASRFEGDDERDWPQARLHFGWWLPTLDESEWPTERLPDDVAALMAERFANLRARDPAD